MSRDNDFDDEVRSHLAHRADDLVRQGLSRDAADRQARIEFGRIEHYKEEARTPSALAQIGRLPEQLGREFAMAWRRLVASPLFSLFSVATLALGIGLTTAVYSAVYVVAVPDRGVREPAAIVHVQQQAAGNALRTTPAEFALLRSTHDVFAAVAASSSFSAAIVGAGATELTAGLAVSGEFFELLGTRASLGRTLGPGDEAPDAPLAVVLSDAVWRRLFEARPDVVGSALRIGGRPFTVVGIMPPRFSGWSPRGAWPGVWVALTAHPMSVLDRARSSQRRMLDIIARVAPGRTMTEVDARLAVLVPTFEDIALVARPTTQPPRSLVASPAFGLDLERGATARAGARILLGLPALVLLVACSNLANLVLSRGVSRQHDFAVRRALGASRWRLVREQLAEGILIAAAGCALGLVVAGRLIDYGMSRLLDTFGAVPPVSLYQPRLEFPVVMAAVGTALLALIISSLVPALQLTRQSDRRLLSSDSGAATMPRWRGRSNLIALQVSISVCLFLLTAVGVTVTTARGGHPSGLPGSDVAAVMMPFGAQTRDEAAVRLAIEQIIATVRRELRVGAVGIATMPNWPGASQIALTPLDRPPSGPLDGVSVFLEVADDDSLRLLGRELVAGRTFGDGDVPGAPRALIVTRALGRAVFGPGNVVGRAVLGRLHPSGELAEYQIVGVTADPPAAGQAAREAMAAYVPFAQHFEPNLAILARAPDGVARTLAAQMREAIRRLDSDVATTYAGRADVGWSQRVVAMVLATQVMAGLAMSALLVSMAGLFGVLLHVVSKRTRELGIRIALGADRGRIARLILRDGFRPVLEGLAIGLGVATVVRVLVVQPAFDDVRVTSIDPVTLGLAAGPLLVCAALACYLPARRAARVDPNVALRDV